MAFSMGRRWGCRTRGMCVAGGCRLVSFFAMTLGGRNYEMASCSYAAGQESIPSRTCPKTGRDRDLEYSLYRMKTRERFSYLQ